MPTTTKRKPRRALGEIMATIDEGARTGPLKSRGGMTLAQWKQQRRDFPHAVAPGAGASLRTLQNIGRLEGRLRGETTSEPLSRQELYGAQAPTRPYERFAIGPNVRVPPLGPPALPSPEEQQRQKTTATLGQGVPQYPRGIGASGAVQGVAPELQPETAMSWDEYKGQMQARRDIAAGADPLKPGEEVTYPGPWVGASGRPGAAAAIPAQPAALTTEQQAARAERATKRTEQLDLRRRAVQDKAMARQTGRRPRTLDQIRRDIEKEKLMSQFGAGGETTPFQVARAKQLGILPKDYQAPMSQADKIDARYDLQAASATKAGQPPHVHANIERARDAAHARRKGGGARKTAFSAAVSGRPTVPEEAEIYLSDRDAVGIGAIAAKGDSAEEELTQAYLAAGVPEDLIPRLMAQHRRQWLTQKQKSLTLQERQTAADRQAAQRRHKQRDWATSTTPTWGFGRGGA